MEHKKPELFLAQAVQQCHPLAIALSDDLYAHPELPDQEFRSSQTMVDLLRQAGYQVEYPYLGYPTGFRAVLDCGDGPSAGILTEYDALPGLGHACGHNVHGAMSILAALALAKVKDRIPGKVVVYGTPAEEENGAKVGMAEQGAFDGLAAAMMIHSWSGGKCVADMDVLSLRCYIAEFTGLSAHAVAGPWKGHSALAAARKFLDLVDARRECFTPDIHVNGVITDGGQYPNILPDRAVVRLEIRTDSQRKLEEMDEVVRKCAQGACLALDCQFTFTKGFEDFADMVRVPALEQAVTELFQDMGLPFAPVPAPNGSSDVGNVSYRCPTIQSLVAICQAPYALHTEQFRDETIREDAHKAIAQGGELIANMIYRILTDAPFREEVARSFQDQRKKKLEG